MKRITTWQQAFKVKGLDPKKMPDVSMIPAEYQKPLIAQYKLNVVAEVLNGDWKPDYTNNGQYKYQPYFIVNATKANPSGSGLAFYYYAHCNAITCCGVRVCYKDWETAEYAGTQFVKLYEDLYLQGK